MIQSYPIHPEVFAQLYEQWTTIDGFQRTRGVQKLMAKVIYRASTGEEYCWDASNLAKLPLSTPMR
jgi:predicted AAA+ superfamily ATPase